MSYNTAASRLSPFVKRAVSTTQRLYEKWETMTPEERERFLAMLNRGASHARGLRSRGARPLGE
jgi:hypothetical protein